MESFSIEIAGGSWRYGSAKKQADRFQWQPADLYAVQVGVRCAFE